MSKESLKNGRKRTRNEEAWASNIAKKARNKVIFKIVCDGEIH